MHHLKQVGWRETLKTLHPSDDGTHSSVSCVCSDILRQEDDLFRELLVKGLALPMREMRTGKRGKRGWKMVMQFPLGRIHTSLFCVIYVYCFMILNQKVCMDWTCRYQIAEFLCHFQVKLTLVTSKNSSFVTSGFLSVKSNHGLSYQVGLVSVPIHVPSCRFGK